MSDTVVFHLKRFWDGRDLWEEIRSGKKTSEWRDIFSHYWVQRLVNKASYARATWAWSGSELDVTSCLKVHKAWFVVGYPKALLPRLEADITALSLHRSKLAHQFEVKFTNVKEVCSIHTAIST